MQAFACAASLFSFGPKRVVSGREKAQVLLQEGQQKGKANSKTTCCLTMRKELDPIVAKTSASGKTNKKPLFGNKQSYGSSASQ